MIYQTLDQQKRKWLLALLLSWLFLFCVFQPATCLASNEPEMYQITETELVTLENNLAQLRSINENLQRELQAQNRELHVLREESSRLVRQLNALKQGSQKQEDLLTNANKLLEQYATEEKRTRLRIKAQRNSWAAAALAACIVCIIK